MITPNVQTAKAKKRGPNMLVEVPATGKYTVGKEI
jgi:hypothetical protein